MNLNKSEFVSEQNTNRDFLDLENLGIEQEKFDNVKKQVKCNLEYLNTVNIDEFDQRMESIFNLKRIEIPIDSNFNDSITFNFVCEKNLYTMIKIHINQEFDLSSPKLFIKFISNNQLAKLYILVDTSIQYEIKTNENQDAQIFKKSLCSFPLDKKKQLINQQIGYKKSLETERIEDLLKFKNEALNLRDHYRTTIKYESENLVDELKLLYKVKNPDEIKLNDDNLVLSNDLFAKDNQNRKLILKIWRGLILIFVTIMSLAQMSKYTGSHTIHYSIRSDIINNQGNCDKDLITKIDQNYKLQKENIKEDRQKSLFFKENCSNSKIVNKDISRSISQDSIISKYNYINKINSQDNENDFDNNQTISYDMFNQLKNNIYHNFEQGVSNILVDKLIISNIFTLLLLSFLFVNQMFPKVFSRAKLLKIIMIRSQIVIIFMNLGAFIYQIGEQYMCININFLVKEKQVLLDQIAYQNMDQEIDENIYENVQTVFMDEHAQSAKFQIVHSGILFIIMVFDQQISNINKINSVNRRDYLKVFILMTLMQFYQNNLQNGKQIYFNFQNQNHDKDLNKDCPYACKLDMFQLTLYQNSYTNSMQDMKSIYCMIALTIEQFLQQILEIILRLIKK